DLGERQVARAGGGLGLAQGEPDIALHLAEQLIVSAPGDLRQQPIPHLLAVKGEALLALATSEASQRRGTLPGGQVIVDFKTLIALKRLEEVVRVVEDAKLG